MDDSPTRAALQALPSIDELLRSEAVLPLLEQHARPLVVAALREAVAQARERL